MRAIDADKLCEDLLTRWSIADEEQEQIVREIMANVVTPIVVSQPTITADRPRGRWRYTDFIWHCDQCGKSPTKGMGYTQSRDELFKFCPHCGADMRVKESE